MKPPPPTLQVSQQPLACNLWVIQMWGEALGESFLRVFTGKLRSAINVGSPGTQMGHTGTEGKATKFNKSPLYHVTCCMQCNAMKHTFFFGHSCFHVDRAGDWGETNTEHDSGYPFIISCGHYNLKARPLHANQSLIQPQASWCSSYSTSVDAEIWTLKQMLTFIVIVKVDSIVRRCYQVIPPSFQPHIKRTEISL